MEQYFSKESLKELEEYEMNFRTSIENGYARNMASSKMAKIKAIYDATFGGNISYNMSCSHCVLTFLSIVGTRYFESKEHYESLDIQESNNKPLTPAERMAKARQAKKK